MFTLSYVYVCCIDLAAPTLVIATSFLYRASGEDKRKDSNTKWLRTVMRQGATGDKTAAWTVLIQSSPVHNLQALDQLIGMVKMKSRREALLVIGGLVVESLNFKTIRYDYNQACSF